MESPTTALSRYTTTSPEDSFSPVLQLAEDAEKFCTAENVDKCVCYFDHVSQKNRFKDVHHQLDVYKWFWNQLLLPGTGGPWVRRLQRQRREVGPSWDAKLCLSSIADVQKFGQATWGHEHEVVYSNTQWEHVSTPSKFSEVFTKLTCTLASLNNLVKWWFDSLYI